ncbi:replication initiator 1-like isoform X1 [Anguilla anguilla]|uniref:replication initiator 1-like isoform X1 n=2 Tax=Anguilla anguilla TaxID=7936 RepID=UPI0015AA8B4E|nr:replication initiator 1-like isoform X1 [Anguilla anguilla]XP_035239957.1 replication initiator 1-like isoform X1 [Anguilla anguilla]
MESICVKGGTLDTLMVTVKQEEEEEQEESLSDSKAISLLCVKQEEGEDKGSKELLGHSPLCSANAQTPKEDPDAPAGERERKKVRRRRREAKAWPPSVAAEGGAGGDSLWRCRLCQRCFSSSWELTGHCCAGAAGGPDGDAAAKLGFWCPVCGDRFLRPTAFILHKRSHVGQSRYVCGVCGRTLKTLRRLATHRRSHARGPFLPHLCQDCSCSFRSLRALRRHRAREHGEEREALGEAAKQEEEEEQEEDGSVPMLSCGSPNHLPQLSQTPQCARCFMTFRDAETAERHLRFKHPAEYERQLRGRTVFACCACDRTFPSSRLLSAHQRTHSKWSLSSLGSEGAPQDRRGEGGAQEGRAEGKGKHLASNGNKINKGGAGSMRCRHCHIIFADPRTWGRHMTAKHPPPTSVQATPGCFSLRPPRGQPRPYSCSTCGEKFIQESSLMKHHTESHAS